MDATPIWFMRQAGRFLPEYRKIREKHDLISICKNPELCAEVTTLPVKALNVDAAIIFADIMLPLEGMSVTFQDRKERRSNNQRNNQEQRTSRISRQVQRG